MDRRRARRAPPGSRRRRRRVLAHRSRPTAWRARHRSQRRHGLRGNGRADSPGVASASRGGPEMLAHVRCQPDAIARSTVRHPRPSGSEVRVDTRTRQLHRVPARLLRRQAVRELVSRHDLRPGLRDRQGPVDEARRRNGALEPGDRRPTAARRLAVGHGHGSRSQHREQAVAGADGGEGRVVTGRRRRPRVLRVSSSR
jgi:hypothetical protein